MAEKYFQVLQDYFKITNPFVSQDKPTTNNSNNTTDPGCIMDCSACELLHLLKKISFSFFFHWVIKKNLLLYDLIPEKI